MVVFCCMSAWRFCNLGNTAHGISGIELQKHYTMRMYLPSLEEPLNPSNCNSCLILSNNDALSSLGITFNSNSQSPDANPNKLTSLSIYSILIGSSP